MTRRRTRAESMPRSRGFTLLELMVAIAIFAVLGLMSSQMLNNMIRHHGIIDTRGERLIGLQRAMTIMQRDLSQIWSRSVRDEYGENLLGSVTVGKDRPIEFTRIGWRNPLGHQRSELQRVAYEHRENTLYRYYWNVLDRAIDSEPLEQVMLEDVLSVEFEPLDGNGDSWPQPGFEPDSASPMLELAALSVRFELEGYGEISRLWEVPAGLDKVRSSEIGTGAVPGTDEGRGSAANSSKARNDNPRAASLLPNRRR